jgi:hypothetical protein
MEKKHNGSNFDDFLETNGILEEITAAAVKRIVAWQIRQEMEIRRKIQRGKPSPSASGVREPTKRC